MILLQTSLVRRQNKLDDDYELRHSSAGEAEKLRQEAAERLYALHEGDAPEGNRRMHPQGVGRHQSDTW